MLGVISTVDGRSQTEVRLEALPCFDGLSVAQNAIFVSMKNGSIACYGN